MLLTWVEHDDGTLAAGSADALMFAADLARRHHAPLAAAAFGGLSGSAPELAKELAGYGVGRLYPVGHERCADYSPEAWGETLAQLIAHARPIGVIAPGSDRGNEVMAHAAARADLPLATNCTSVEPGTSWLLTRIRGGGMLLEDAELTAEVKLVTLAPGAAGWPVDTACDTADDPGHRAVPAGQEPIVEEFHPDLPVELDRSRVARRTELAAGVSLATAPVVVSGGRGVGSAEGYAALEELAGLVGGVVGCSRVATNNGWRPHRDQVGLTGTQIAPALYIACGISGATQHWVGCMHSKTILAVNTDPEAPMVTRADYAVIGDVHEVLPAVITEIRRRNGVAPDSSGNQ